MRESSHSISESRSYLKDNLTAADRASDRLRGPGKLMNDGWDNWSDRER